MKSKDTFQIDLLISITGEIYTIQEIDKKITVREFINAFCDEINLQNGMGAVWHLLNGSQLLNDDDILCNLIEQSGIKKITLMAKVCGAG